MCRHLDQEYHAQTEKQIQKYRANTLKLAVRVLVKILLLRWEWCSIGQICNSLIIGSRDPSHYGVSI